MGIVLVFSRQAAFTKLTAYVKQKLCLNNADLPVLLQERIIVIVDPSDAAGSGSADGSWLLRSPKKDKRRKKKDMGLHRVLVKVS
jgi:hypothetical protein